MATNTDFLQAILANPEEDAPRLIFADWLEEQGQSDRAEFIRGQCELAQLTEEHPRYKLLAAQMETLRAGHETEWLPSFLSKVPYRWERGFVSCLWTSPRIFLAIAPKLFIWEPVQHLQFTIDSDKRADHAQLVKCMADLGHSPWLEKIRTLNLYDIPIGDRGLEVLLTHGVPRLQNLRTLYLFCAELTNASVGSLVAARLPACTTLSLDLNRFTDEGVIRFAKELDWPALTKLHLCFNNFQAAGAEALVKATRLAHVMLDLRCNRLSDSAKERLKRYAPRVTL